MRSEKSCVMKNSLYSSSDTIRMIKSKHDAVRKVCSTHGKDEKCIQNCTQKTWSEESKLEI